MCFKCSEKRSFTNQPKSSTENCVHTFIELAPQKLIDFDLDFFSEGSSSEGQIGKNSNPMSSATAVLDANVGIDFKRSYSSESLNEVNHPAHPVTLNFNPFHGGQNGRTPSRREGNCSPPEFDSISIQDENSSVPLIDSEERLMVGLLLMRRIEI